MKLAMLLSNLTLLFAFLFVVRTEPLSPVSSSPDDFSRVKRRENEQGYFEQCRDINLPGKRLGYVNVFAFLDASWHYSYRQAVMLRLLKKRLEKAGFSDIRFFVVTAPPGLPEDKSEDAMEIEAWMGISMMESQEFLGKQEIPESNVDENHGTGITFLQDSPELGIWGKLRVSRNEVIIVDRCGKLTYQVIVPWSILYFPYVKAAILFTYNEDPCGPCNIRYSPEHESIDYEDKVRQTADGASAEIDFSPANVESEKFHDAENTTSSGTDSDPVRASSSENKGNEKVVDTKIEELKMLRSKGSLPLRIIMRAPHVHAKDAAPTKYKYLILKTDNPEYHGHLDTEKNIVLRNETGRSLKSDRLNKTVLDVHGSKNGTEYVYDKDESPGLYGEVADYWKNYDDDYYTGKNETVEANADYNDVTDADGRNSLGSLHDLQNGIESDNVDPGHLIGKIEDESDESAQNVSKVMNFEGTDTAYTDTDATDEINQEEEFRKRFLERYYYYKLLPWIYYVLDK